MQNASLTLVLQVVQTVLPTLQEKIGHKKATGTVSSRNMQSDLE